MIVAVSTSSHWASVALLDEDGSVRYAESEESARNASGAVCRLLQTGLTELNLSLREVSGFVADSGPGSFTGVKVGVTFTKTMAFALNSRIALVSSFDLIDPDQVVAIPHKRAEWHIRVPGCAPVLTKEPIEVGITGYGFGLEIEQFPEAKNTSRVLNTLFWMKPELAVPSYGAEPSISFPKRGVNVEALGE